MGPDPLTGTLRETLAQFDSVAEPRTTMEVAEDLDLGRRSTYNRLERLVDHDRLDTKKVGANGRVWWRPPAAAPATPDWPAAAESLVDDVLDDVEVGMVVLDENFDVAWINEATERYFGIDGTDAIGQENRQLIEDHLRSIVDDSERFAETVLATYDDNTYTEQFECHVTAGDDREERWLEHRSQPIDAGAYAGGRVELYYDVTDRKQTQPARRKDREQFKSLVSAVEEYAIFTLDPDGYVQSWNPGVERIKDYEADDFLGEHVSTFYTEEERAAGIPEQNLEAAAEHGSIEDEGWRVREDGSRFWASVTLTAIRGDDDTLQGYAKVVRDMTERRERERKLREEKAFTESILDNQSDLVYAFDTDGEFLRWNDRFNEVTGYTDAEITAMQPAEFIADDAADDLAATLKQVVAHGSSVSVELPLETKAGEEIPYRFTGGPLTSDGTVRGFTGIGRDISDEKARQRRLERQRDELQAELGDIFERVDDAFYALDDEMRFEYVNDRAENLLGDSESELLGRTVWEALSVTDDPIRERFQNALETQTATSFERYSEPLGIWVIVRVYPSESGLSVYFTDITERKQRERQLEEYRHWTQTLIENLPSGAVALVDENLRYITFGGTPEGDTDVTREDLEGQPVREALPEQIADVVVPAYEAALGGKPSEFEETIDGRVYQFNFVPVRDDDGDVFAATAMSQDITEQKGREDLLREAKVQLEAATEAGAVGTWEWHIPDDEFVAGASFAKTFGVDPDEAREGVSIDKFMSAIHEDDRERVRRSVNDAMAACGEYQEEYRVENADGEYRWVVARGRVECDVDGNPITFPGALVDITERKHAEKELERQREQLAALNNLNEVVRDITTAVIEQSTREEIEQIVCERLAGYDSYEFAWICEVDSATESVVPRVEAGVEGYVENIPLSIDSDDPFGQGPVGEAVRTKDLQTANAFEDAEFEPWHDYAREYGYQSAAAIPIVNEGTLYGVLGVYADRPDAFDGWERALVNQLGEVVGHAIAAAERKQALQSDELVELDFQILDIFAAVDAPVATSGTITLDDMVPIEDREFLVYGTATQDALDTVHRLTDVLSHWESVTIVSDDDEPVRFELRMIDPPVLSAIASRGGYIDQAIIEDGDYRITIHLAPSVDVRQVTDAVEATHPQAELLRRHQIRRPHDESRRLKRRLAGDLTDRQRSALEAAYHAGFFEWPRETTGEQIAESLGIAPPTFHQHLRKAQRKTLDAVL